MVVASQSWTGSNDCDLFVQALKATNISYLRKPGHKSRVSQAKLECSGATMETQWAIHR